jgi:HEXXH motif-containing protein
MLDTHKVSLESLDTLAQGRSDPAIVGMLRRINQSKQLMLLRAVLDLVNDKKPAMPHSFELDEAWRLLVEAQRRDRDAVNQVIGHPRTVPWAVSAIRRLRNAGRDDPPLWVLLGYLNQLATAAAIRAGHDFRSRVPVWRGTVMLPTLGLADVRSRREWDFAQVHGEQGYVLIRGPAGSAQIPQDRTVEGVGWWPLRSLDINGSGLWLDDLDPYREFDGPLPPQRLPANEVALWQESLRETWRLLADDHPATAAELGVGLTTIVPHSVTDGLRPFSRSHSDAFGSVALSRPADPTTFAATLIHELQHSKFGVLLTLIDLLEPDGDNTAARFEAPWRDDPRPAEGLLHGVVSFLGVTAFYRERCGVETGSRARLAQFEFANHREQTLRAVRTLLAEATPSALGRRFLSAARDHLEKWAADPLPHDVRAAAERANADHHLSWRLRHLRLDPGMVEELTQAWLRNWRKPVVRVAPTLVPSAGPVDNARLALTRAWLADSALYDVYRAEPELAMAEVRGATTADLSLVDGDAKGAAELYQRQIIAHPTLSAWAGLALATEDPVLLDRPELVAAVHQAIRARSGVVTDPIQLARWLA